jgi:hypothetical protein
VIEKMNVITFLSDFGKNSLYVSQMKGVALSIVDAKLVDITHEIKAHNIKEGAFVLKSVVSHFPVGTVHVAVVDPGVGSDRRGIVITTDSQIFVGPDNGLLIPAAKSLGKFTVYEIKNEKFMNKIISNTFHGRDIFTPVAANILNGAYFTDIGPIINDYNDLDFGTGKISEKSAEGKVIYVDSFGNIITNILGSEIKKVIDFDSKLMLFVGKRPKRISFVKSYDFVKKGDALATIGSSGYLEISINQSNASEKLKIKEDDEIKILFS